MSKFPSLEEYVAHEVEQTRLSMERWQLKNPVDDRGRDRLDRAEEYARWRYGQWQIGEVATL